MKNYYDILGLEHNCSDAEIKKAYRQLALQYHPDKNNGDAESEERFKLIADAYSILSDEIARVEYDFIKGYRAGYERYKSGSGKPSPIKFLLHIKAIKTRVLQNGGRVDRQVLYSLVNNLLSEENIEHLRYERDAKTNNLIIDDVLTCAIFIDDALKEEIYTKLELLADRYPGFKEKIALHRTPYTKAPLSDNADTGEQTAASPSATTILMFILFLLLFIVIVAVKIL